MKLLYGCGLRVAEVLAHRVKYVEVDVDVGGGNEDKDRVITRPKSLLHPIEVRLKHIRAIFDADRRESVPRVVMTNAYEVKSPKAAKSLP